MSFSFGFSGDDIEEDPNDAMDGVQQEQRKPRDGDTTAPQPIPARLHDLDEMVSHTYTQLNTFSIFSTWTYSIPSDRSVLIVSKMTPHPFSTTTDLHHSSPPFPTKSPTQP
jgi:protein-histidine N-methyltransferase